MQVLPCHHQFHTTCVDKWLKEVHRQMVHILDRTTIISLLQPQPETYELFDDIILLSDGQIVYQGPREFDLQFFESKGFRCPERKAVAEFLQQIYGSSVNGPLHSYLIFGLRHMYDEEKALEVDGEGKYERISGTNVGGGTYWGMGRLLTKCARLGYMILGQLKMAIKDQLHPQLIGIDYLSVAAYDHSIPSHLVFLERKEVVLFSCTIGIAK